MTQFCYTVAMATEHSVGLRELRHNTGTVLTRVQRGESIDVTDRGRLVARIVPVIEPAPGPVLARLIEAGRVRRATRPGFRPAMHPGVGTDRLGGALAALRDEQAW